MSALLPTRNTCETYKRLTCASRTFTYLVILRVATLYPVFRHVLPADAERAIWTGKRNLQRFGVSVAEFAWHIDLLERIDAACRHRLPIPG